MFDRLLTDGRWTFDEWFMLTQCGDVFAVFFL